MTSLHARTRQDEVFRLMVEAAPQAMLMVDHTGLIAYVNARSETLFGYPRGFLLGKSVDILLPENVRDNHPNMRAAFMKSPGTRAMGAGRDLYGQHSDGTNIPLEVGLNPVTTDNGVYVIVSIIDISERKRQQAELQDQTARIRAIVETAVDSVIVIDDAGIIETANPATEKLLGYRIDELQGQNIHMLMPEPYRGQHDGYLQNYRETGERKIIGIGRVVVAQRKDGSTFPIELAVSEMTIAGERKYTGIIRDITERQKAEEKLQHQVEETEQALQRVRETQDQLMQSERLATLGGLVAGIAHEVNTPLGIGVSAASYLQEQVHDVKHGLDTDNLRKSDLERFLKACDESADILLTNIRRAADLIQSFKKVAVDQTSDKRRTINLGEYLNELLHSLRPRLKKTPHRVYIKSTEAVYIETIPGSLSQVIINLIMNSLVHAFGETDRGVIEIALSKKNSEAYLTFRDNGKGIPEGDLGKIFEPFFTTRIDQGGSGLGLHIVYNLVNQILCGKIAVESNPGAGTVFYITLPAKLPGENMDASAPEQLQKVQIDV
ncbi:PAS domain S-box protein [Litorivivens sp.]|uniref:PAS domain-containing sensor histidine kinase n=1 Tax=Litorivivens sp. TaxID=2020868 RepID=UPI0035620BA7